ncbi:MAG: hypothetical protein ACOY9B_06600 [Pseudomonadota bacterium]
MSPRQDEAGARVRLEKRPGYLRAVFEGGDGRLETMLRCWNEAGDAMRAQGARAAMIVDRLAGEQVTSEQQRRVVTTIADHGGFAGVRFAYVIRPQAVFAFVESAELLARELGLEGRVFDTESDAELWLRHGER